MRGMGTPGVMGPAPIKTTVINLFAGPGAGKSTAAAELFFNLKNMGKTVELVREVAKEWAWAGKKIRKIDQLIISAEQFHREASLYGKVEFIITDSPVWIAGAYEERYQGHDLSRPLLEGCMKLALESGVTHLNYLITRHKPYEQQGRFESEQQAIEVDRDIEAYLVKNRILFKKVAAPDHIRGSVILGNILEKV